MKNRFLISNKDLMPSFIALVINIFKVFYAVETRWKDLTNGFWVIKIECLTKKHLGFITANTLRPHYAHTLFTMRFNVLTAFSSGIARARFESAFFFFSSSISLTRPHMSHLRNHKPHQMLIYFFFAFSSSSFSIWLISMERVCVCKINNFRARQCKNSNAESF